MMKDSNDSCRVFRVCIYCFWASVCPFYFHNRQRPPASYHPNCWVSFILPFF
uniref:Uncharacterized protein n=1 Tax=Anguilla anguilla TaxID=7936 RepID=A0A0E9QEY3_ANGAN